MKLPRHLHQIWIGDPKKRPRVLMDGWKLPGWDYTVWTEKEIDAFGLVNRRLYDFYYKQKMYYGAANVVRVEVLHRHGGVYVDADTERLLPFVDAPFLQTCDFFAVRANTNAGVPKGVSRIANGVIGAIPSNPILTAYSSELGKQKVVVPSWSTTGGTLLTKVIGQHKTEHTTLLPPHTFYPFDSQGRSSTSQRGSALPTYARHFWGATHKLYSETWDPRKTTPAAASTPASVPLPAVTAPKPAKNMDKVRAIILCAGDATRWNNHRGVPKHLVEIEGERILDRAVRLLRSRGIDDVHIVVKAPSPAYEVSGAKQAVVTVDYKQNADADKYLSSKSLWNQEGRTLVVLGDVYFTEATMNTIVSFREREWTIFCRPNPSKITGGKHGEIFAQSFYPEHLASHEKALHRIADLHKRKVIDRSSGWEHYRAVVGRPDSKIRQPHVMSTNFVEIDDWTEDFDYPEDYETWLKRRRAATVSK